MVEEVEVLIEEGDIFSTRITNKDSISTISMLYSLDENPRRDQFIIFQQELEQHVLKKIEKSGDIVGLVTKMTDPTQIMLRDIPRASEIEKNIDKLPWTQIQIKT